MPMFQLKTACILLGCALLTASCETWRNAKLDPDAFTSNAGRGANATGDGTSILDIFRSGAANVKVNRFLWTASLEILDFLPVESADPFTGVIVTGYGRPPGGNSSYRATILISDPALDARSLNVALQTRNGPVDIATQTAVEDAILARARQLRVNSKNF